jgi:alkaline phosphatase D
LALSLVLWAAWVDVIGAQVTTIAFGSCLRQWQPQPVWSAILAAAPDAFIFVGDNVYTDTGPFREMPEPDRIAAAYAHLAQEPGYLTLRSRVPIYAVWDDHDYGRNDGGREYPWKAESERVFLDFFDVPMTAPERSRPGIYGVRYLDHQGKRIQILLLDTRYFRSPLAVGTKTQQCPRRHLVANAGPDATILGEAQWHWLAEELRQPADLRLLVSSIQVLPNTHCYEKWGNFPKERERLFQTIRDAHAHGVVILSGDRHLGDISELPADVVGYPIYEVTASGMNSASVGMGEANPYRVGKDNVREDHFGLLKIDWQKGRAELTFELRGVYGRPLMSILRPLDALR